MHQKILIILIVNIFTISCSIKNKQNQETFLNDTNAHNIKISEEQITGNLLPIEACIHKVIPLETNKKSTIGNYFKLAFTEDKVIILDNMNMKNESSKPKVLMFDTIGKFNRKIGNYGRGPGEYSVPLNLQIGQKNDIQIYCNRKSSILSYSPDGKHIATTKLPYRSSHSIALNSGNYIFAYPTAKKSEFKIGIYNQKEDSIYKMLPFSEKEKKYPGGIKINPKFGFSKHNNQFFYCPQKSKKIYKLTEGSLEVKYQLDIAGLDFHFFKTPKGFDLRKDGILKLHKLRTSKSDGKDQLEYITFMQTDSYERFNFSYNWHPRVYTILRNKLTGNILVGTTQSKIRNNLKEISNQLLFHAKTTYNGKFVAAINTERLKNLVNIYGKQTIEKKKELCYDYSKLKEVSDSRDEISNSVLIVFSLKEAQ